MICGINRFAVADYRRHPSRRPYHPDVGKPRVSGESAATDTVIDNATNQVVATGSRLCGEVGNRQFRGAGHEIMVGVGTRNQVVTIDLQTPERRSIKPVRSCKPSAVD